MKCHICCLYNLNSLPAGSNLKRTQRNGICPMGVFHFAEIGKLKYVQHTIDIYSSFQCTSSLIFENADSVIKHLLEIMDGILQHMSPVK